MTLNEFVSSGGASVWHFAPRGTAATHMWDIGNIFNVNMYFGMMVNKCWAGFGIVVSILFSFELARLFLNGSVKDHWKSVLFRLLLVASLFRFYGEVVSVPAEAADSFMSAIADDQANNDALFTFMSTAEKGMLATFNPTGAVGTALKNESSENLLQGLSYTIFYLVWWMLPVAMCGIIMSLYVVGPYCLAFLVFTPFSRVAGMWIKLLGGCFLAYAMLCVAFHLLLASQVFLAAGTTNSISDPFSTIAFSVAGLLTAFSMPGMAVRLLGGHLSFIPGRQ